MKESSFWEIIEAIIYFYLFLMFGIKFRAMLGKHITELQTSSC